MNSIRLGLSSNASGMEAITADKESTPRFSGAACFFGDERFLEASPFGFFGFTKLSSSGDVLRLDRGGGEPGSLGGEALRLARAAREPGSLEENMAE